MNLDEIDKKCFILALFIRDDGQRFLLGSGAYEFKDSQLHFSANTMSNDVVEVQGNDGYLLAGQVRRPTTQVFDGYIGDASINKPDIEGYRRDFFAFFQKNHFYTVVYIFPDGTAIQRRRGFIVDAGEIRELYQMFPEYHIGLNFEDVNYYKYSEDEDGHEQYAKSIDINISKAVSGGLIWDSVSQTQAYNHGTDFSINGTIENEPVDHIDLYGDTEQQTYSGKNLFNISSYDGIKQNADGTVKSTKYYTAATAVSLHLEASTRYTISIRNSSGKLNGQGWGVAVNGTWINTTAGTGAVTTDANGDVTLTVGASSYGAIGGYNSFFQLEKGSTATSYEPYVGGTASPNPDYPQEVQTVTGEQTIEIRGSKNLLNPATLTTDSRLNGDGAVLSGATGFSTSDYIPVEPNTTYTITRDAASSGFFGNLCQYNSSKTLVGTREYWDNAASYWPYHITTSSTTRYIRVSDQTTLFGTSFQIEKGSTATPYVPYRGQSYEINLGKNLLNPNTFVKGRIDRGVVGYASDTSVLSNTTNTITFTTTANYRGAASDFIAVDAETQYRLQQQLQSGTTNYIDFYDTSKTWISRAVSNPFTTPQDCGYVRVSYQGNTAGTYTVTNLQLEKGSIATTYAPYFTPIELCKIGTYQDYIYKSGEDWYVHKETAKVTFTGAGTETWSSATAATGYVRFSTASGETHADNNGYCNEFINRGSQSHGAYEYVWVQPNANAFYIQVLSTRANDLAGFRTWLGAHPATVYYDITTPTDTQITNADLIAQLEALNSATTYAGVTWFKTESQYFPADTWAYVQIQAGGGVVWDNYGATWEEGGGGMIVNVNVDSIENVYPVWTVNGPTDTPILTNLTTGTSITYNGNITASQTLVVDMLNQTALLNGTSVIGKLSGDWIELAPGMNRMSYTATNEQTAPKSTLEWQEIVG